ncbi:uncharacterized protein [Centruroides vittatus]|uniref:uncharacterized protein n=1 Tax=Centruroides vittatus TaxID=120091 RepID=UPI00350FDE89
MATAYELVVVNTYFDKCEEHLITYKSRDHKTQIDYLLTRRTTLKEIKECKVIPGEDLTSQHRLLVMELKIDLNRIKYKDKLIPKIKWWLLKGERAIKFREKVISVINRNTKCDDSVDEWWTQVAREIRRIAKELLGETKPARKIEKEVWWWNEEVKKAIREKKDAFKSWQKEKGDNKVREKKRVVNVQMKKKAKKVVATAKAQAQDEMYRSLTGKEGRKPYIDLQK